MTRYREILLGVGQILLCDDESSSTDRQPAPSVGQRDTNDRERRQAKSSPATAAGEPFSQLFHLQLKFSYQSIQILGKLGKLCRTARYFFH